MDVFNGYINTTFLTSLFTACGYSPGVALRTLVRNAAHCQRKLFAIVHWTTIGQYPKLKGRIKIGGYTNLPALCSQSVRSLVLSSVNMLESIKTNNESKRTQSNVGLDKEPHMA
ncbi:hypothetical protein IW262DRAFT_1484595 [Armillaria fumosa]|nr:hypothetical protein IW262DRAFT_1484595 [Armillaria fumosa]